MLMIRPFEPQRDAQPVYTLWQQTLDHHWPLAYETFHAITMAHPAYQQGDHLVACSDEEIVGFIATQTQQRQSSLQGNILLLIVAPAYQRRGIGRKLHDQALAAFKQRGVGEIQLGGGFSYFWQGVPTNLPEAWQFFQACGWTEGERSFDLVRALAGYTTPAHVYERLRPGITLTQATQADVPAILGFVGQHFPGWLPHYQRVLEHMGYADMVVAKDPVWGIVGTSYVLDPHATWWQQDIRWLTLLGESTGGVGPLGVAEFMREQGIGLALAARVTELLGERRLANSYVHWTWLVDWYGTLGYQVWQEYFMSWRKL